MNRLGIATLLLISVIALCGFELFKINYTSETITNDLTLIQQLVSEGNIEEAKHLSSNIFDFWENNTIFLAIFVQHDSLENIEQSLALMNSAIEQNEISSFWSENIRALVQIENLSDTEYPTVENIL